MQFKRFAVPAVLAFTLSACGGGDDKSPTGSGGLNDAQRLQAFADFAEAGGNAANRGAPNASVAFYLAGYSFLFGGASGNATVSSNGLSFSVAGEQPNFATAGSYKVTGIRVIDISTYGSQGTETEEFSALIAYRDTTDIIWALGEGGQSGTFDSEAVFGGIYQAPNMEWIATSGSAGLTGSASGTNCNISAAIRQAIDEEIDDGHLQSFECKLATFNGSLNITDSQPGQHASGSRTASFSGSVPGVVVTVRYNYPSR